MMLSAAMTRSISKPQFNTQSVSSCAGLFARKDGIIGVHQALI